MQDLFTAKHDLLRDEDFKRKYFSDTLRARINDSLVQCATYKPPKETPWLTHPAQQGENQTLFMAWDLPTSFKIKSQQIKGKNATVDVIYYWGPDTQYAGDTRVTTVVLSRTNDVWYIDDLLTRKGKFISESSFYSGLLR